MKKILFSLLIALMVPAYSQNVAINASGAPPAASAMLDVSSTSSGLLIPRMTSAQRVAIASPAQGLYVFDLTTNSFWFFNGVIWVEVTSSATGWLLAGNTLAGTEKLGSLNAQPLRFFSNNVERARIISTGEFVVGSTTPFSGHVFSSYATGSSTAVAAFGTGTGITVYAENTGNADAAILGQSTNAFGGGIFGYNANAGGAGVIGIGNNINGYIWLGGSGGAFSGSILGVLAVSDNSSAAVASSGILGRDAGGSWTIPTGGAGVSGSGGSTGLGVFAYNSGTGTALYATNSSSANATLRAVNTESTAGTGGIFGGNNLSGVSLPGGSGLTAQGSTLGVYGYGNSAANDVWGGYFATGNNDYAYIGGRTAGGVVQKINGTGAVSTIVKNTKGESVNLYCPESPEILFQDFGTGTLVNGQAHITLDPDFSRNIIVNQNHPLRVIIQLEGDCKGVFVTNKSATGFDVKELQNGNSSIPFTWFVSANRADEPENNAVYSKARFGSAPLHQQHIVSEKKELKEAAEPKTVSARLKHSSSK